MSIAWWKVDRPIKYQNNQNIGIKLKPGTKLFRGVKIKIY